MILPDVKAAILKDWEDVPDPIGGGVREVFDGLAITLLNDGRFAVQNLDADDGEPYFSGSTSYVDALKRAQEILGGWIEYYEENPDQAPLPIRAS